MDGVLHAQPPLRRLAAGWLLLALSALALSTVFAVLLVLARTPASSVLASAGDLFGRALVLHVSLAVVVWFLCAAAAIWTLAAGGAAGAWRWAALVLAALGVLAMLVAVLQDASVPVLANYLPVLDSVVFLAGLSLFLAGIALCAVACGSALIRQVAWRQLEPWRLGAALSMLAALIAVAALVVSLALLGLPRQAGAFEILAWGPGHVLQFVHVVLLMSVWIVLGEQVLGQALAPRDWLTALLLLAAAPVLLAPVIYLSVPIDGSEFRRWFTALMVWGAWPAGALLAMRLLQQLKRAGRTVWATPPGVALLLSVLLFLLGCGLGALIRNDSTMVPAHYHGTVGAVTLAYMALGYQLLAAFGPAHTAATLPRWQPLLYGSGLLVLALALAWSGSLGVPRKTLHVDVLVRYPSYFAAMALVALGGLMALAGAGMFVINVVQRLRDGRRAAPARARRRDVRWPAVGLTLGLTGALGALLAYWPSERPGDDVAARHADPRRDASLHAAQMRSQEVEQRFSRAVQLLGLKQFEAAGSELHRVLELAPQMPEAHVNMGFAMLGLQRYAVARDFFGVAIDLKRTQINAYFGLAVALEGLHDLPGALGAMRSYIHLSAAQDSHLPKAHAAIGRWEAALKRQPGPGATDQQAMALPSSERNPMVEASPVRTP